MLFPLPLRPFAFSTDNYHLSTPQSDHCHIHVRGVDKKVAIVENIVILVKLLLENRNLWKTISF